MKKILVIALVASASFLGTATTAGPSLLRHETEVGGAQTDRYHDVQRHEDLASIERRRVAALVAGDMEVARRLHAHDFQLINPLGGALSKSEYLDGIESGFLDYLVWQPGEISVRRNGNTGVLRYQSELQIVIAGETQPLGRFWHTDYYEKRQGRWQVVWSHATAIPNP